MKITKKKLGKLPLPEAILKAINWVDECLKHLGELDYKDEVISYARKLSEARVGAPFYWEMIELRKVDRCSSILFGPNFCSDAHPWPSRAGLPMLPYIQLDLTECKKLFILPTGVPSGLVQVFMPQGSVLGRESFVRIIPESECKQDAATAYPILTKKSDPSEIYQWNKAGQEIQQFSGFGSIHHYVNVHTSVDEFLEYYDFADLAEKLQVSHEDLLEVSNAVDDLRTGETCLMGNFSSIQYELNEMKGEPLFCIGEGDWGVGNAQIFYERVDGEPRFHFNWSC